MNFIVTFSMQKFLHNQIHKINSQYSLFLYIISLFAHSHGLELLGKFVLVPFVVFSLFVSCRKYDFSGFCDVNGIHLFTNVSFNSFDQFSHSCHVKFKDFIGFDSIEGFGLLLFTADKPCEVGVGVGLFVDFHLNHSCAFNTVGSCLVLGLDVDNVERVPLSFEALFRLNVFQIIKKVLFLAKYPQVNLLGFESFSST